MPIWILVWSAAHTLFFFAAYRLQPFLTDWFYFACVCVRNIWRGVQAMFLNSCMIRRAPSFFFGRIHTLAFSDRLFILLRGYVSGAVKEALRQWLFQSMYNHLRTTNFFWLGGQSQLKYCAKCSTASKNSSRTGTISTQSSKNQQHSAIRPCWFQWFTSHGTSVMTHIEVGQS